MTLVRVVPTLDTAKEQRGSRHRGADGPAAASRCLFVGTTGRHLLGHFKLRQLRVFHALLELLRKGALERACLHFVKDSLFLEEIVEFGTGTRITYRNAARATDTVR